MTERDFSAELASIDGRVLPVSETTVPITDEGFLRGDGAFEVLRVYGGFPFALDEHLDRLERSAEGLLLAGVDRARLEAEVAALLEQRGGGDFALRVICTRGGLRIAMTEPVGHYAELAALGFVTYRPTIVIDGLKTLSYAANMLATRLAQERGFDDALLVTPEGEVLEAPTATLFWSDGETLYTPPLSEGILASITRRVIVEGVAVEQRITTTDDLVAASEAFLCSSVREVQAVGRVEGTVLAAPGAWTERAIAVLSDYIQARLPGDTPNR